MILSNKTLILRSLTNWLKLFDLWIFLSHVSADFVYISASSQNGDFFPKTWRELPFSKWKYSFLHRFYEKYLLQTLISDEIRIQKCITIGAVEKSRHPTMYLSPIRRRVLRFIHEDEIINLAKLGTMVQDPPAAAKSLMSKVRPTARFLGKIYELNEKWHSSLC